MTQSESTTRTTIAHCTSVAKALADWYDRLPATFLPSSISAEDVDSNVPSDYYDVYEDVWTASSMNSYRTNCILVHEALINQLDFLRWRHPRDLNEPWSIEERISHSRGMILSLVDAVCASVHSLLQSDLAAAGVSLLWPLYVSAQISPRTAPVREATRAWLIGRLEQIGAGMGVCQGTMLAGLLSRKIEVTDALKDESCSVTELA